MGMAGEKGVQGCEGRNCLEMSWFAGERPTKWWVRWQFPNQASETDVEMRGEWCQGEHRCRWWGMMSMLKGWNLG